MEQPVKKHLEYEPNILEEEHRVNLEKTETNFRLQERIQERKYAIEKFTQKLHTYKQVLNRVSNTEYGRIAILIVEQKNTIDQKYKKQRMLLPITGMGLMLISIVLYILGELSQMYWVGIIAFLLAVCSIVLIIIRVQMDENRFQYRQFKRIYEKQAKVNNLTERKFSKELFTEQIQPTMKQYVELSSFIEVEYPKRIEILTEQIKDLESRLM
jgi:hypothetical protein